MKIIVLDACALIAYIRREKGAVMVERHLKDPENRIMMHSVNFFEVYYDYLRNQPSTAYMLYDLLKGLKIKLFNRLDKKITEEGTAFKILYKMSLADSIAIGFTAKLNATLLTADRHELAEIAREKLVKIKFIR